ncbi:hypothetical protein QJS66_07075 [Kocuria rhizophila]|nr:hypothetical protein QJS66_07075 [Kocuria rhizophila]
MRELAAQDAHRPAASVLTWCVSRGSAGSLARRGHGRDQPTSPGSTPSSTTGHRAGQDAGFGNGALYANIIRRGGAAAVGLATALLKHGGRRPMLLTGLCGTIVSLTAFALAHPARPAGQPLHGPGRCSRGSWCSWLYAVLHRMVTWLYMSRSSRCPCAGGNGRVRVVAVDMMTFVVGLTFPLATDALGAGTPC